MREKNDDDDDDDDDDLVSIFRENTRAYSYPTRRSMNISQDLCDKLRKFFLPYNELLQKLLIERGILDIDHAPLFLRS